MPQISVSIPNPTINEEVPIKKETTVRNITCNTEVVL